MKAVVYKGPEEIAVEEVPNPCIEAPEDAIVRITKTAICGSDLHILHDELGVLPGTIIGHEFTGVVEEVGPAVTNVKIGDRVAGAAGIACGRCEACLNHLVVACQHLGIYGCGPLFGDLPGAQSEYIRVQFANMTLERIPDNLTDEQVLFVGDILSTAYMAAEGITPGGPGIQRGSTVAVLGAGPVGLCAVAAARLFGPARIIAVDLFDYRLDMAARLGADYIVNAADSDAADAIIDLTGGRGADFIIETTGKSSAFDQGLQAIAYGGTMSIVGIYQDPVELPVHLYLPKNVGIRMGLANVTQMKKLIRLIEAGRLDLTPIITHRMPLSDAVKGYEIFDKKLDGAIKVVLEP